MSAAQVIFDLRGKRVFVAGHAGMVGSALVRRLERENCDIVFASRADLDLRHSDEVDRFMAQAKPDAVFVAAGKVGGISANSRFPADFIADNIAIAHNTIGAAYRCGVKKLVYLGSSCIYPRLAPQPMAPDMLLSGPLEHQPVVRGRQDRRHQIMRGLSAAARRGFCVGDAHQPLRARRQLSSGG